MAGILEIKRGTVDVASLADGEFYLNKGKNSVQIGSGSSILTLLPINKTVTGNILLNGSIYADNISASALTQTITASVDIGGIPSGSVLTKGTTLESILNQILVAYTKPVLNSFNVSFAGNIIENNYDVGDVLEFNTIVINSSPDNSNIYPYSASYSIGGSSFDDGIRNLTNLSNANQTFNLITSETIEKITSGSVSITVNANRTDNNQPLPAITKVYNFRFRNYLIATSTIINSDLSANSVVNDNQNLVDSTLDTDQVWFATCDSKNNDPTKYTYIIYPYTYSDLTSIAQGETEVIGAFEKLSGLYQISNSYNRNTRYKIYKSNVPGAFASGVILKIV